MIEKMIQIRTDADETQRELAKAIKWHQVQIARYETGTNTPSIEYLKAFCQHYKVSADYILGLPDNLDWPRKNKNYFFVQRRKALFFILRIEIGITAVIKIYTIPSETKPVLKTEKKPTNLIHHYHPQ